ncbi:MAG: hypothetical protein ABSB22_26705 [Thermodesulfobacteriota bacterium]|jgi:hypothetical protein
MDNKIRSKWEFLIQSRPTVRAMIGNSKLIGGHFRHNGTHARIFHFITAKGTFTFNEVTEEFKSEFQIRQGVLELFGGIGYLLTRPDFSIENI